MRIFLFSLAAFLLIVSTTDVHAQSIDPNVVDQEILDSSQACNVPRDVEEIAAVDKTRWKYCDMGMRQFEYRERYKELKRRLTTRAENFKNSTYAVRQNYKKELEKYHASLGSE